MQILVQCQTDIILGGVRKLTILDPNIIDIRTQTEDPPTTVATNLLDLSVSIHLLDDDDHEDYIPLCNCTEPDSPPTTPDAISNTLLLAESNILFGEFQK